MALTFVSRLASSFIVASCIFQSEAGTITHAKLHSKRQSTLSIATDLPAGWQFSSCYTDSVNARTLFGSVYTSGTSMTQESCIAYCAGLNYGYAGTEYAGECYCDNTIASTGVPAAFSDCSMNCNGNTTEACGGPNRISLFYNNATATAPSTSIVTAGVSTTTAAAAATASTSNGWASIGCFSDSVQARTLTYAQGVPNGPGGMTVEQCTSACQLGGYSLAGVEYAQECYCGNALSSGGAKEPDMSGCNMPCAGNVSEYCGGSNRINIYDFNNAYPTSAIPTIGAPTTSSTAPPSASTSAALDWTYLGCYTDATHTRTLLNVQAANANPTVETCIAACAKSGYTLAGVEFGGECWCDNTLHNGGGPAPDGNTGCNLACTGNAAEICGGSNRLSVYTPATLGWQSLGCYTDNVQTRTLKTSVQISGGGAAMTVEMCQGACNAAGFTLAGVEYAAECYCDKAVENGGVPATDGRCNMACNGNANEICGGPNGLSVYSLGVYNASNSATTTSSTSASATSTATGTVATSLPTGWNYTGCYNDNTGGRSMMYNQPDNQQLTIESCVQLCSSQGYSIAGMEYTYQCFCDNYLRNGATLAAQDSDCAMPCGGNSNEICGGPNLLSIYADGPIQIYQPPAAQNQTGQWQYQGCMLDSSTGSRTLPYQLILAENNTATNCLDQCAAFGYMAGGMEYGEECYCGDIADVTASGATLQPETDCNMACSGNGSYICGAGNRLSYYTWQGPAIQNWTYASGTAAGEYVYLINAPVVALITNAGVNGKVTFIEKFGTSPAMNSTGAYELDLSQTDAYDAAWRTMHVATDVFCSAGLTLPDKVGRQINVGGWSDVSTYGIRLYIPDGSPGVEGVNDWQENPNELALQVGRWYPSAMIMTNGSILIMGGEDGSNGAPVPSLELLPNPNKIAPMYCDYLARTDPFNLYPFLAVMPSGNILVMYYNEARLLDPVSLNTVKTLPNIPGAVNNFLGGRTYPLEGTSMLMPQHAPYSDPVTVLICGGSVPGPNLPIALDNCVSIQPDSNNATWQLERMPSKRVISCMTALPDGTYLILNGGQYGVAGFGLASQPNHNALLYDPTKPVNQRITVMANTTIDRLYHSEAVLLQDGRVLVSGSDPEDPRFLQEFRVETFIPSYLLTGLPQPKFTINQTDWSYGQTYSFLVTSSSGAAPKVSLMGAVSSTHGNSMGQRTLFPAVSCSGNVCTVTAPPNGKVCPPGWFQMFVLDGPTPSHSRWIRIGGDPGQLGNWPPNLPDFTLPGMGAVNTTMQ